MCNACYVKLRLSLDKTQRLRSLMRRRWSSYISAAAAQGVPWLLTKMDFVGLWQQPCWWCMQPIATIGLCRVDKQGAFDTGNVRPCCQSCNRRVFMRT